MKRRIKFLTLTLAALSLGFVLASCAESSSQGGATSTSVQTPNASTSAQQQPSTSVGPTEVQDCNVPTGKYMINKTVYDYDKTTKKVIVTEYTNYTSYLNNTGTKKFEADVKFVEYSAGVNAVYFVNGDYTYYFYMNEGVVKYRQVKGLSYSTGTAASADSLLVPAVGTYVSEAQEHTKVDSQGNRTKETVYYFIEISEGSVKVYVGETNTTKGDTLVLEQNNYVLELISGKVVIRMPHQTEGYKCTIYAKSATTIHATNDYEKAGDYDFSCNFTKMA